MYCKYIKPWIGKCNEKCDEDYCEEHNKEKCCICGNQATHGCDNTSFLVCGSPLCDNKICDTIHEVYSHKWNLEEFMSWTGREHTEDEISYIKDFVLKKEIEFQELLKQVKNFSRNINEVTKLSSEEVSQGIHECYKALKK